jgi:pyruvate formate lyase activating enzyme
MELSGGREYTAEEIINECKRSKAMFFSGGGVTFTGGEATLQAKELLEVLMGLKAAGIHTAIETNATSDSLPAISEYVDYLIMDFKHYDGEVLKRVTGANLGRIRDNLERLLKTRSQLHIRIPLINGFNADGALRFAELFCEFDMGACVFEFLPYHEYGKEKWKSEYKVTDGFIKKEQLSAFIEAFKKYNLKVINT